MSLSTPLSERIGIQHPFMQAGMGGIGPITLARLAAAISEAGALGTLAQPALVLEEGGGEQEGVEEQVAEVVEQVRSGIRLAVSLTDKPLAINVRIAQEQPDAPEVLRAILEERERDHKVRSQLIVLTTSGGHPHMYGMNGDFRDSGMLHFHAVSNVRHALTAKREGIDGVIATGFEAAGHVGHRPVHTFVLVPSIAAAVDLPVLCAGGVVDGAALAGALTLGAELGYIGSRFLASEECEYHEGNKRFIVAADETQTEVIPAFFGPARFIENGFTDEVKRLEAEGASRFERMKIEGAAMRRGALEGDMETGMMIGGQGIGRISAVLPAAEIVAQIAAEAEQALARVERFEVDFGFTDEQRMLREMVVDFVERECPKPVARELEASGEYPAELAAAIARAGLNGIGVPEAFGGQGGDIIDQCIVCEELSRSLGGLAWLWGITVWSGAKALLLHGSDEQRDELLPKIADGSLTYAFALTEPGGGTDVLRAMRTRAKRVDGGWVLRGNKIWSTLAHVADRILVLARTSDEAKPSRGLTMFNVDGRSPGLEAVPIPKLGMRALGSCEVAFDDVFVPDADVLGEVGGGWRQVTASLNSERIMVAAMCTGILRGVLEDAVAYAKDRHAFGKPIGALQAVQHHIADIAMDVETCRLHTYRSAWLEREGRPCGVEATTAKCLTAELACKGADMGIQILGGYGYANEYDMQRYWRDVRLYRIGPISTEMSKNFIGESLGLPRSF